MPVVINTNITATFAANNLARSSAAQGRSLNRLSSGSRIVNPADDAAGLAVSMKLTAASRRMAATGNNLANTVSFLQTQDGVLASSATLLQRISELKTLNSDPTKNASDRSNYQTEFVALQAQLLANTQETFNGKSLFGTSGLSLATTEDASSTLALAGVNLLGGSFAPFSDNFVDLSNWSGAGLAVGGNQFSAHNVTGTTNRTFSGALEISFEAYLPGSGDTWDIALGGQTLSSLAAEFDMSRLAWHTIHISLDAAGNASTTIDGAANPFNDRAGVSTAAASLSLSNSGLGAGLIRNFSVTSGVAASGVGEVQAAPSLDSLSLTTVNSALQEVAGYRASNGSQQSRLAYSSDLLTANKTNLEAATSRLVDVDVATESAVLAKNNILVQAGTAMLTQANQSSQLTLRLITG